MKISLSLPLVVITLLNVLGCSSVSTTHPLSSDPQPIDKAKLEGVWLLDDATIHIKFADDNVVKFAGLDWKNDAFRINEGEAIVTEGTQHNFLSIRARNSDGTWEDYVFVPYRFSDHGYMVLWPPIPEKFAELVDAKTLQGTIDKGQHTINVTITNAPGALFEIVDDSENMSLFDYRNPVVLKKLSE